MGVGIDIGSKTIKIVELEKAGNFWTLLKAGVINYNLSFTEALADDKKLASLADIIKKLCKGSKITAKNLAVSLPEAQVFTRLVRFPLLTDNEIASAVKWEAEQYIPIPMAEAIVQHQIIEKNEKSTPPEVLVLLVAAPEKLVEKYIQLFQLAGLNVSFVESELLALVRSLAPGDRTVLLLDFGASSTGIAIARAKNLVFSRSVATAGNALTRTLSQNLQVDEVQAEEYKKSYGLSKNMVEGKVEQSLLPALNSIVDEIKKAIHFYQTDEKGELPRTVIVTGGGAGLPGLTAYLTKQLNLEVIVGNPFNGIKVQPEAGKALAGLAPLYGIAVGLAEKGE